MSDQQYEQEPAGVDAEYVAEQPSAGSMLHAAREARGESLADVAHALKLAPRQIEAMELDQFDLLPGPAFVRGFLRNYARYLGVDSESVLAALSLDVAQQKVELAPVTNATGALPDGNGRQLMLKPAVIIILGLLLALSMGWYFDWFKVAQVRPVVTTSEIEPLHGAPMSPEVLVDLPGQEGVPEPTGEQGQLASAQLEVEPALEVTVSPQAIDEVVQQVVEPVVAAVTPALVPTEEPALVAEHEAPAVPPSPPVVEDALPAGLSRLVFKLDGESWIQVRDTDDVTLFSGVAAAGTTRTVQGKPPFSLVIGNAAKVVLEHDGKRVDLVPHVGSGGVVRMKLEQAQR